MLRTARVVAVILSFALSAAAATKAKNLPDHSKKWLTEEVVYTITEEEKKQFLTLDNEQARDEFIQNFWEIRNPLRGSKSNPFKEEHYKRIDYANSHFGRQSNTPGWMTDMGRTYIEFGKPTSAHKFIGYGQIYPLELWSYTNETGNASIPPFFYVLYYIPDDIGEYRFYRPGFDGPLKLVRGTSLNSNKAVYNFLKPLGGDVAHAAFSLIPNDPIDNTEFTTDMGSDLLVNKIVNFANDPFTVRRIRELRSLKEKVSSSFLVQQEKKLALTTLVLTDPLGRYWLDYGVLVDDPKLGQADKAKKEIGLSFAYHLYNESGELIIEDSEDRTYPAFDSSSPEGTFQPFILANRLPIEAGSYRLEVNISNRTSGQTYRAEQHLVVGAVKELSLTGPLLADSVDSVGRPDAVTPFQYFGAQFHPVAGRPFDRRRPMRLLFELQRAADAQGDLQIEYLVAHIHDREARDRQTEEVPGSSFRDGRLIKSKSLNISQLEAGDYRLVVNIRRTGSLEVAATVNLPVKIEDQETELPLFFSSLSKGLAAKGVVPYIRGLEALSQKHGPSAETYLAQALHETPTNTDASQLLVQLYFGERKYADVAGIYNQLGIEPFRASADTLAQISLSFWNTGNRSQAQDVLDAATSYFPNHALLAQTKSLYAKQAAR